MGTVKETKESLTAIFDSRPRTAQACSDSLIPQIKAVVTEEIKAVVTELEIEEREREKDLQVSAIQANQEISKAASAIAAFFSGTTLREVLQTQVVHNTLSGMLQGLAANGGRKALDANLIDQNALEIAHAVEATIRKVTAHAISRAGIPEVKEVLSGEELSGYSDTDKE